MSTSGGNHFGSSNHTKGNVNAAQEDAPLKAQLSEAEIIEQRRKKRKAIKAKHKSQPGLLVQALEQSMPSAPVTPAHDSSDTPSEQQSPPSSIGSPRTPHRDSLPVSPAPFTVDDDEELANHHQVDNALNDEEGPSAADYDPNLDMQEDRPDHKRHDLQDNEHDEEMTDVTAKEPQAVTDQKKEFDMFADDDDDDMFALADSKAKAATNTKQGKTLDESLQDNWDYPDGHYRIILGELLNGRYAVQQQIGKDPDDKKHIIRLLRNFDHKGHLCLVFEALSADLREVLKKFGRNVGLNLRAIRSYAQQMFLSLSHMKKCQILHADLKPDNVLVSEKRNLLKVYDLGTAAFADDAEITPYLVSRFYRAPEVILGMPFNYAIDMWSISCTLFELYTGRILFAGADNNQMLRVIQECRGKFPIRMLKRSTLADRHFDVDGNFFSQDRDKITGKATLRQVNFNKTAAGKDLRGRLSGNAKGMAPPELREHAAFVDLMEKCLQLDPARRITPNDALRHHFVAPSAVAVEKPAAKVVPAMGFPRMK
ncbi:U4/U6 small nuclear ribonucleoprotein prp4 [Elasticomyces elasticus]|nr:U4/U6 small nuclear ribonucleoprotein prp4 [Elasticomyces elasticus]